MQHSLAKDQFKFIGIIVIVLGIIVGIILVRSNLDLRQRASTSTGTAKIVFSYNGGATVIPPNSSSSISINASGTGQSQLDGYQVIADITGTVPADISLVPGTFNDLSVAAQSITDISGGKRMTLVFLTKSPTTPFNANGGTINLGTLRFTSSASGSMTITVNQTMSKILQTSTGTDLLGLMSPYVFTFGSVATPTAVPTLTPVPTSIVTPTPTVRPTLTPVPTIIATPTPTARPTLTPVPTSIVTPTPFPTATPITGANQITVLAKFVGVTQNVGSILAKFTDATGSTASLTFTYSANGVYKSVVPMQSGVAVPATVTISVKPEKHVQRVFRDKAVTNNTLDLTATPFEPGDLPVQDGVVNSADISKVIAVISKPSPTATDLQTADVNYDGVVNSVDIGLILTTLSNKPDESL